MHFPVLREKFLNSVINDFSHCSEGNGSSSIDEIEIFTSENGIWHS